MATKKESPMGKLQKRSRASSALSDAFQGKPPVFQEVSNVDQIIAHYLEREEEVSKDTDALADWLESRHGAEEQGEAGSRKKSA